MSLKKGNRAAAFTLLFLTPLIAEIAFGSTPLTLAYLFVILVPVYGAGVLMIRELVQRAGRGWLSIVLLGCAYEVAEDGLGIQALSSPNIYHAAEWGARVFGINIVYWEVNIVYHVVFSVLIPIFLTDLLFPAHRGVPYLKKTGLIIAGLFWLLGIGLLRIAISGTQDPGYQSPLWVILGCIALIAILTFCALSLLPRRTMLQRQEHAVPPRWSLWVFGLLTTCLILFILYPPPGGKQPGYTTGMWVLVPMVAGAALITLIVLLIAHWMSSTIWTDRHTLTLTGGALVGHTIIGLVNVHYNTLIDRVGLVVIIILTVALIWLLDRKLQHRAISATPDPISVTP